MCTCRCGPRLRLVLPQGRYAALLVSLHGTGLYERYDASKDTPENAQAVQDYLAQERAFQEEVLASLRVDPHYAPYAIEEAVARNRRLVQVWDALTLTICFGNWQTWSVQLPGPAGLPRKKRRPASHRGRGHGSH